MTHESDYSAVYKVEAEKISKRNAACASIQVATKSNDELQPKCHAGGRSTAAAPRSKKKTISCLDFLIKTPVPPVG